MAVERAKETVRLKLVNGEHADCQIYKYLNFRKRQQLTNELFQGIKVSQNQKNIEDLESSRLFDLIDKIAKDIWADSHYTLDDIEGESLSGVIIDRFSTFLGNVGYKTEDGNNPSS